MEVVVVVVVIVIDTLVQVIQGGTWKSRGNCGWPVVR